jgi:purine-binding chemotaxis protein CheW
MILNDDKAAQATLARRAARYAHAERQESGTQIDLIVFRCGASHFALPLESMREVRPLTKFCPIPGASAVVPGVFHLRGQLVSLHSLEAFMGRVASPPAWALLVPVADGLCALSADEVIGISKVQLTSLLPLPITLGERSACFRGMLDAGTLVIDPPALFATAEFSQAFPSY